MIQKSIKVIKITSADEMFDEVKAKDFLEAIWSGNIVNKTENRQALHPALRAPKKKIFPIQDHRAPVVQNAPRHQKSHDTPMFLFELFLLML